MMRMIRVVLSVLALISFAVAQPSPAWTNDPQIESRVEQLLKQMTLEEKVGQLVT